MRLALVLATLAGLAFGSGPLRAQVNMQAEPVAWLQQVYALYERAQKDDSLQGQATYELVKKRASRSLAALFKRNDECEKKSEGVCALDWDFIIDGQDYKISDVKVGAFVATGDKGTVTVSFKNMTEADFNVYHFVRESGVWKVEDVVTHQAGNSVTSIAKMLRDFKV